MDKSKELATLLGIKPICLYFYGLGFDRLSGYHKKKHVLKDSYEFQNNKNLKIEKVKFTYPDFEKPANFVNLLEFYWNNFGVIALRKNEKDINFTDKFMNQLNKNLRDLYEVQNYPEFKEKLKTIKKQAQAIEWQY